MPKLHVRNDELEEMVAKYATVNRMAMVDGLSLICHRNDNIRDLVRAIGLVISLKDYEASDEEVRTAVRVLSTAIGRETSAAWAKASDLYHKF